MEIDSLTILKEKSKVKVSARLHKGRIGSLPLLVFHGCQLPWLVATWLWSSSLSSYCPWPCLLCMIVFQGVDLWLQVTKKHIYCECTQLPSEAYWWNWECMGSQVSLQAYLFLWEFLESCYFLPGSFSLSPNPSLCLSLSFGSVRILGCK